MTDSAQPLYVRPDQLRIGVFVVLELPWLDHDFSRNSFKIKNAEQLAQLQKLGLQAIRIDPLRSDTPPLSLDATPKIPTITTTTPKEDTAALQSKHERIERISARRAAVKQCEIQFLKAASALKVINSNLFSRPALAHQEAAQLVQQMLDSILTDKDIAIHLMNDKVAGEEMYLHSLNVTVLAVMLARELGLPAADIKQLGIGCLLHDIGKLDIPDRVRMKTEPLTRAERNLIQQHCQYGVTVAAKMGLSPAASDIIGQHHEHTDGSGYPKQLKAGQISPLARIAAIANTYDNLCNQPDLLESANPHEALSQMFAQQRHAFDADALNLFIRCMGVYPPGTIVRLSDETFGVVVSINAAQALRPTILIYDPAVPRAEAIIIELAQEPELHIVASLKAAQLPHDVHDYLSPKKRTTYYFDSPQQTGGKR